MLRSRSLPLPRGCQASQERKCLIGKSTLQPFSLQDDEGATHEKLDFRLHFSCSSYLITTPCYRCVSTPPHSSWEERRGRVC
jgi:hypothetical protein